MTEAEWLTCNNPTPMLEFLRGKASDRQLRLFAVACCRRIWRLISDERCQHAVESAELRADNRIGLEKGEEALLGACDAFQDAGEYDPYEEPIADLTSSLLCPEVQDALHPKPFSAQQVSEMCADLVGCEASYASGDDPGGKEFEKTKAVELAVLCAMLREIMGNPFRPAAVNPVWRTPTVTMLAATIYEERFLPSGELDPVRLAVLADALEEAGCYDAAILNHCRQPGQHVRGCWLIDLLTGKE